MLYRAWYLIIKGKNLQYATIATATCCNGDFLGESVRFFWLLEKFVYFCENLERNMAKDLAEQLSRIGHKAELLVTRYATLKDENQRLREEILQLKATVAAHEATIERQAVEIENFRICTSFAPDADSARQARATIAELVREIDVCVADLMKDI